MTSLQLVAGVTAMLLAPWLIIKAVGAFRGHQYLPIAVVLATVVPALLVVAAREGMFAEEGVPTLVGYSTVAALLFVGLHQLAERHRGTALGFALLGFGLIEVWAALTNAQLGDGSKAIGQIAIILIGPALMASFYSADLSRRNKAGLVAYTGALVCGISLAAWFFNPEPYMVGTSARAGGGLLQERFVGVANNPNTFGMIAAVTLIAATLRRGWSMWVVALVALPALLLTGQRAGMMSALVLAAGLGVTRTRHTAGRVLIAFAFLALMVPLFQSVYTSDEVDSDQSFADRQDAWAFVLGHVSELWLSGWGPAGLLERTRLDGIGTGLHHAHNEAMTALAVGGLPMLFLLVLVLVLGARAAVANRAPADRNIVGLLAVVPFLIFESPLHTGMNPMNVPQVASIYLVAAALTSVAIGTGDPSQGGSHPPPPTARHRQRPIGAAARRSRNRQVQ
ncbi:O-antigen ligase family protein [Nocardioides seonyuensis]|uniref:O-antigen ligase family protein n=1 Tax=Nocardioides seonyuensis TaxID=2518371 RepID=UPI001FC9A8B3|nr:O-antigen ligase family protein [Nocardioides seonyuensis]